MNDRIVQFLAHEDGPAPEQPAETGRSDPVPHSCTYVPVPMNDLTCVQCPAHEDGPAPEQLAGTGSSDLVPHSCTYE
jgi:hypothetical protein